MRKFGWQVGWLMMSAIACSHLAADESGEHSSEGDAGQANEGGESGTVAGEGGGTPVVAGAGGATPVEGGGDDCSRTPRDLAEYCSRNDCPQTPDDVDLGFCGGDDVAQHPRITRGASSCGISVSLDTDWDGLVYHFDTGGSLVGVAWYSDALDDCPDSVGRACALKGPQTALCGDLERCEAVSLEYLCDDVSSCSVFESSEIAKQELCAEGGGVERFASSCGGSVFRHDSGTTVREWSFNADGELRGVVATSVTATPCPNHMGYSAVAVYGKPCEAIGERTDPCTSDSQGGAGGSGTD